MLDTHVPTPVFTSSSETVLLGDTAGERRSDSNPHEYFDVYCDERGRNTGARMRQNFNFSEIEQQRSMGCERQGSYSYSVQTRQNESRRGRSNAGRANQNHSDLLFI